MKFELFDAMTFIKLYFGGFALIAGPLALFCFACRSERKAMTGRRRAFLLAVSVMAIIWILGHLEGEFPTYWQFPSINKLDYPIMVDNEIHFYEPVSVKIWLRDLAWLVCPICLLFIFMRPWKAS
jgi:hypothetical protein